MRILVSDRGYLSGVFNPYKSWCEKSLSIVIKILIMLMLCNLCGACMFIKCTVKLQFYF